MGAVRVLAFLEASTVTGPAANLLQFSRAAAALAADGGPDAQLTIALFHRDRRGAQSCSELGDAAEAAGVEVIPVVERFRFDAFTIAAVRRLVAARRPDVVQTHSVKSHLLARLSGLARTSAWVAFHHGYTRPDAKMAVYNQSDRVSLRAAALVVTPARAFVPELARRGVAADRIAVVHNGFELERDLDAQIAAARHQLRASLGVARHQRLVVCVGRLSREKGHADLVDSVAVLRAHAPSLPLRVVVAGDGPERSALEARAAAAGVADAFGWLGFVPRAQHLYAAADAAVLPSHSEGSPNALLEAAAYRVPIVATSVGGVTEILAHGQSGLLVEPRQPRALASALREILVDSLRAADLARHARRVVETRHDPVSRARTLIALYESVMRRRTTLGTEGARACAY
jgi:glycosyltransferase involved in cell wall biosynthesis